MTIVFTDAARRSRVTDLADLRGVGTRRELWCRGISDVRIKAQLSALRWRRIGTAIVLHNGPLTPEQARRVATINCGPRAVPTSFTAATAWGLTGWEREEVHVLAPGGTTRPAISGLVLHRTRDWQSCRHRADARTSSACPCPRPRGGELPAVPARLRDPRVRCAATPVPSRRTLRGPRQRPPGATPGGVAQRRPRHLARCAGAERDRLPQTVPSVRTPASRRIRRSGSSRTGGGATSMSSGGCRTAA